MKFLQLSLLAITLLSVNFVTAFAVEESSATTNATPAPTEDKLGYFDWLLHIPSDYVGAGESIWRKETIAPALAVIGSTAVLMKYDYELWQPLAAHYGESKSYKRVSDIGASMGKGDRQILLGGVFLVAGIASKSHRSLRTASQVLEGVLATGILDQVMKHAIGRQSPDSVTTCRTGCWQPFTKLSTYNKHVAAYDAYPSGHLLTALTTVEVIRRNYAEQSWIPYVGYPLVAVVANGMVATSGHWWSDYPISIFLAYHFAKAVTANNPEQIALQKTASTWDVNYFTPFPGAQGLAFTTSF